MPSGFCYRDKVKLLLHPCSRLSMAVAPKAIEWASTKPNEIIFGEGDRLNNKGFFNACDGLTILHLTVSDEERQRRYEERGSNQPEKFIQTVRTKVSNITEEFGDKQTLFGLEEGCVVEMRHESPEDTKKIVLFLNTFTILSTTTLCSPFQGIFFLQSLTWFSMSFSISS